MVFWGQIIIFSQNTFHLTVSLLHYSASHQHVKYLPLFGTSAPALNTFLFLKTLSQGIDANYKKIKKITYLRLITGLSRHRSVTNTINKKSVKTEKRSLKKKKPWFFGAIHLTVSLLHYSAQWTAAPWHGRHCGSVRRAIL